MSLSPRGGASSGRLEPRDTLSPETATQAQALRARIGRIGVWAGPIGELPAGDERTAVARLEGAGFGAVWIGEAPASREALSHAALLLASSERMSIATGIANIWARDAVAAFNGASTLNEAYDERFLLGLGVSHAPVVSLRGHDYGKPLSAMRSYLDAIDQHTYYGPAPSARPPVVLAALRPKMLELARDRSAGAHPYFVPPAHTATARATLGPGPLLAPEQAVVLETDPARARTIAREHMAVYLMLPNYLSNLRELGYEDADFSDGGSDRLVDAIVAWGNEETIAERVREHLDAGADHVALQACVQKPGEALAQLLRLAPAVLAL